MKKNCIRERTFNQIRDGTVNMTIKHNGFAMGKNGDSHANRHMRRIYVRSMCVCTMEGTSRGAGVENWFLITKYIWRLAHCIISFSPVVMPGIILKIKA